MDPENTNAASDYSTVTEGPGIRVTREAVSMLYTRYHYAAQLCSKKDVLEVGCGTGMGLGYLARQAHTVVGADFSEELLKQAQRYYQSRLPLLRIDAHYLPFRESSFDIVVIFEAIYYFAQPMLVLAECKRVLRSKGVLLLCLANRAWEGFNPSPFSETYLSCCELYQALSSAGFSPQVFAAYSARPRNSLQQIVSRIRKAAVKLKIVPKTMVGKEWLKRVFYGSLKTLPDEIEPDERFVAEPLFKLSPHDTAQGFKVLYAVAPRVG